MTGERQVYEEILGLTTEARNPRSARIDRLSTRGILRVIHREDAKVPAAVRKEIPRIAKAVDLVVDAFRRGGRLFYVGAGTSGRLGVLDAAECPPTFGTPPDMVQGIIAGGPRALVRAVEGAEDRSAEGARAIRSRRVGPKDVVVGIAASRRTPFVLAAVREARARGARTVYLTMNPVRGVPVRVDVAICPVVGPEVVTGSTRMKSGTAQKLVLNMITTASMIRLGKVHGNLMVDLTATSAKLRERSKRILMIVCGVDYEAAAALLERARGRVKTAIVMEALDLDRAKAEARLARAGGFVRKALGRRAPRGARS